MAGLSAFRVWGFQGMGFVCVVCRYAYINIDTDIYVLESHAALMGLA